MVVKHLRVQFEYLKVAVNTAIEYRANFIIQAAAMFLNDWVWILFWYIFFSKFSEVQGWQFTDVMLLYGVLTMAYGIGGLLFGNRNYIAGVIAEGKLDYYLTLPKNILYHVLISRCNWYDLGDFLFGLVIIILLVPIAKIPLLILLIIFSTTILLAYSVITGSLSFFFGNAEETTKNINMGLISIGSYPLSIYQGITRIIILTIIPAGFISGVPVELLKEFNIQWFIILAGFTVLISTLAIIIFYAGLKKYESGNQLYVRM